MKIMSNVRVFSTVILMLILAVIPVVQAKQIFYNSLDSEKAVKDGFSEITLLGQNVNSYNHHHRRFEELLAEVAQVPYLKRIRYTSPHPQDMTQEVLDVMLKYDNICNYIHLPLQAGNNNVLNRMNRTYKKEDLEID